MGDTSRIVSTYYNFLCLSTLFHESNTNYILLIVLVFFWSLPETLFRIVACGEGSQKSVYSTMFGWTRLQRRQRERRV